MRRMGIALTIAGIALSFSYGLAHAEDSSRAVGREIYDAYCGACHGFDGKPLLANTPDFASGERMEKPDSELLTSIRTGKGKLMPAWFGILNDKQSEAVLNFIRLSIRSDVQKAD